jgi:hypothetical protein
MECGSSREPADMFFDNLPNFSTAWAYLLKFVSAFEIRR